MLRWKGSIIELVEKDGNQCPYALDMSVFMEELEEMLKSLGFSDRRLRDETLQPYQQEGADD